MSKNIFFYYIFILNIKINLAAFGPVHCFHSKNQG